MISILTIESGSFTFTSGFDTYDVTYRYAGEGVIAYDYNKTTDWEEMAEVGGEIAKTTITTILVIAAFVGSAGLIPIYG